MDKKAIEGFYRLQDGTQADPADVSKGDDGVFRHKNGLAVSLNAKAEPLTIGQEAVDNKVKPADVDKKPDEAEKRPPPITEDVSHKAAQHK